jgi:hypothetical protein
MRAVLAAAQTQREQRRAILEIPMVWIEGRDRETHEVHGLGLWGGPDVENIWVTDMFTGASVRRTFYHQGVLGIGSVRNEVGFGVKAVTISLSSINTAVQIAIRGYDPRGAKVQVWKRGYNPDTRKPLGVEPYFKGYINEAPIERPAPGGDAAIEAEVVSTARMLTMTSALLKSHEAQKHRAPGDNFRKYKGSAGNWDVAWGQADE